MTIFLGADHRGFLLKQQVIKALEGKGFDVRDNGALTRDPEDDYVDFAGAVAKDVVQTPESRGIVFCGSGVGVDVTANKIQGIRSCLGFSPEQVRAARADDDINVLSLASDFLDLTTAQELIDIFLKTPFKGEERHLRRLAKIEELERKHE